MRSISILALCLALSACMTEVQDLDASLARYGQVPPTKERFIHCYGYGCPRHPMLGFASEEWRKIERVFDEPGRPKSAEEERARLRIALGLMERFVGDKDGTTADAGGSFGGYFGSNQLDCVDEMLNTATYVRLLIHEGLVVYHEPGHRLTNQFFKNGSMWPHTVSTIRDKSTGAEWAVDSWWLKNGMPPYIVTREAWSNGAWERPKDDTAKYDAETRWDEVLSRLD